MMNLILALTLYPTMLILFLVLRHQIKTDDRLVFGTHLPPSLKRSDAVREITVRFNKRMRLLLYLILLTPIFCLLSSHVSIQFLIWMTWFLLGLAAMAVPYGKAYQECMALKEKYAAADPESAGPQNPSSVMYVELHIVRIVRFCEFLPQILLSAATVLVMIFADRIFRFDGSRMARLEVYQGVVAVFALLTPLFYLFALWTDRIRATVISFDSDVNIAYNRARKYVWKKIWIRSCWVHSLILLVIAAVALWDFHSYGLFLVLCILETILGLLVVLLGIRRLRNIDAQYDDRRDTSFETDDDRYWIWGMFYNNPHDSRTLVDKRFGVGTTTNMATRLGKVTLWVAFFALIWIPFMNIWLIMEDFTPIRLVCSEQAVVCTHLKEDFVIPYDEITDVELLDELPTERRKVWGTGTDRMEKGKYEASDVGSYYTFVNPENQCFIRIDTAEKFYIICAEEDEETREVYQEIRKSVQERLGVLDAARLSTKCSSTSRACDGEA